MGRLVVIEGLDGAGKRTLADALTAELRQRGKTVARRAFPRYGEDVHADLVRDALQGRLGDTVDSVYAMAVLYALDRRGAADSLRADLATHDVVLLDRYVASNAAYCAARLHQDAHGEFVGWAYDLEIRRFGVPVPDLHLLLQVPVEVAAARAVQREAVEADRARDSYETDAGLQARCAKVYQQLAAEHWLADWHVVDGVGSMDIAELGARVL
ncbi:dTMP kinase [Crossiella sp. CA-258035]|uniref:dTMP kinase n=1 Tax=Crossiella sp. CA-258035 TaxID=2981138 RepID=UPI0024BC9E77|nr:dTMP kinase [Crossiella sp. CA-258035]WHT20404.1 dTMP kinase [Crossiella sp. CA-258035]